VAEVEHLTLDPLVTPGGVLGCEPPDERGDLGADRLPADAVSVVAAGSLGVLRATRRTRAPMFRRVAGRPDLPRMDRAAQRRRTMFRCQCTIVSGVTSSPARGGRAFGITPSGAGPSRARSAHAELRAARLPPLQDREQVAQDQDFGGLPRLLTPGLVA
jgi:hypothetical protein